MKKSDLQRHQIIERLTAQPTETIVDTSINLWAQLATQIISIVGDSGFNALYTRSLFLAQPTYPWLAAHASSSPTGQRFAELRISFETQTPEVARAANCLLLITFTDILISLIGEPLTTRIFSSAWGKHAQESASKEYKNE